MCHQTEIIEECSQCGFTTSFLGPIENCELRSQQLFDSQNTNSTGSYLRRCYGVATTSYTDAIICEVCVAKEERDRIRQNKKAAAYAREN
ncbi:hypothetical protein FBEOM_12530 [Fusarium beomiforme]|uniref:Uncharacterized protein n=1 Tax=Fusarium beomiforme TaxID=44412 RepID=A0A9P5A7E4_9HYPO|nr:hypothetical protein FBEOM_12530 [Fusarium beomiforme]